MSENVEDRLSFIAVLPYFDVTDQTDFVRKNRNQFNKVRCPVTRISNYGSRRRRTAQLLLSACCCDDRQSGQDSQPDGKKRRKYSRKADGIMNIEGNSLHL